MSQGNAVHEKKRSLATSGGETYGYDSKSATSASHRKMTARIHPHPTAPSPSSGNKTRVMIYHRVCPSERLDYPSPGLAASLMVIR